MPADTKNIRKYVHAFDFVTLFIEELGWDNYRLNQPIVVDGQTFQLSAIAEKRGMVVFHCPTIPDNQTRRKIEREIAKLYRENFIVYSDTAKTQQVWQWVRRQAGKPLANRERVYYKGQAGENVVQALAAIAFELEEEPNLTIVGVTSHFENLNVERVTRQFYDRFKREHDAFLTFIDGIPDEELHHWYASVMLNRLMFIYFIQKKGFLDGDINYLRTKLDQSQGNYYLDFLCPLFFKGFATKDHPADVKRLLGDVPYLNGGLFMPHQIEERYGEAIQIEDSAFDKLFAFFDGYNWHLDERPLRNDNEINPDVLGYIFEKYINQKQMGAYYTKEDITGYISKNTVIPYLFDQAAKEVKIAFDGEHTVWDLLVETPERYIYPAVAYGAELELPDYIAFGIEDVSQRGDWNTPAPAEYALPTEIWREVVSRRQRYEEVRSKLLNGEVRSINDLITLNLDIQQFAQDVIDNAESSDVIRAFWKAINGVTVLDPTCGSGAFLFAALNILEPLYESCLERMEGFIAETDRPGERSNQKYSDFRKVLERVEQHPNHHYFILKSIIISNLFGVDIMEEAVEICKLRLFLKLVAQIGENDKIEPLPDIDFNIRAGNTLVGFATQSEVKAALTTTNSGQAKLMFGEDLESLSRIEEKASDIDRLFKRFREQQTELGGDVRPEDKAELGSRLKELEAELNLLLAGQYGVDTRKISEYENWLHSHQPFHWFIDFYGVLKAGGFDVIIGNPPYVEYSQVKKNYQLLHYRTIKAGNLYVYVIERSLNLQKTGSYIGMIIQLSAFCTPRMLPFQDVWFENVDNNHLSFFDDRPGKLFDGLEHIRVSIPIGRINKLTQKTLRTYTTRYIKFPTSTRNIVFHTLSYQYNVSPRHEGSVLKVSESIENGVVKKIWSQSGQIGNYLQPESSSDNFVYYGYGFGYWGKILNFKPYFKGESIEASTGDKYLYCRQLFQRDIFVAVMNSSLFYWFYVNFSDGHNFTKYVITSFPFIFPASNIVQKLISLTKLLMSDLRSNSRTKEAQYKATGTIQYQEFYPRLSKAIIDEIDSVLAEHYGFTDHELDFILNYDIKYRMGIGSVEEIEEGDEGTEE